MILGAEPVTLTRTSPGSRGALGAYTSGATTVSTIMMGVQPLSEADRKEVAALATRASIERKGYTESEVRTVDQYDATLADRITVDGVVYVCMGAARERSIIPHYKVWLSRLTEGQS